MYFAFRVKGREPSEPYAVSLSTEGILVRTADALARITVNRACARLGCERHELELDEASNMIQLLAEQQRWVDFGSVEWCELQGAIDKAAQCRADA